jgi:heme exporter protein A
MTDAPTSSTPSRLAGRALSCVRDDRVLFSGLGFAVDEGEALVIEGRNGTGKTTLLRAVCGIRRPDEGEILWGDESIERLGPEYHRHVAYVGHNDGVKRELTVAENLRMARALGSEGELTIGEALRRVHLAGFEDVVASNLSAGQRRRLALARLLVTDSLLWVLDEPFTSLDRHGIGIVEELMAAHVANGGMLVMTSHHEVSLHRTAVHRLNLSA